MGLSIFQIGLTLSFLVTLIVVLRLYRGVRMLNARVSILSNLVRELRKSQESAEPGLETPETETSEAFVKDLEEDQALEGAMQRDFKYTHKKRRASPRSTRSAKELRGRPANEISKKPVDLTALKASSSSEATGAPAIRPRRQRRASQAPAQANDEVMARLKKLEEQLGQTMEERRTLAMKNSALQAKKEELESMNEFLEDRFSEQEQEKVALKQKLGAH